MYRLITLLGLLTVVFTQNSVNAKLTNKNIERVLDLSTQLAKISATITLENAGKDSVKSYLLELEPSLNGTLSYVSTKDARNGELKIVPLNDKSFNILLSQPLPGGSAATITVDYVVSKALNPYPSSINQKERQLVRYFGNHYFYSPYLTKKQTTNVILNTKNVENYSKLKPVSQSDTSISYGPYNDVEPHAINVLTVHYENNAPFLEVTRIDRLIEVSHWGNIAVEENIEIYHAGAKLKGPFSRYDYQREATHHSVKSYHSILPAAAHSIYYRDSNGNISTSQVRHRKDWIELELRPRFPLFGGWKSSYTLGYSIPSYEYLFKTASSQYVLKVRLLDHVVDDMHIEEVETHIVLPVGVKNVKLNLPYNVERLEDGVTYKYLDTIGRQIIKLKKTNLVEQHIQDVEITYEWQSILLFHEPLLVSVFLYLLFVFVIIYVRLDFSIGNQDHPKSQ